MDFKLSSEYKPSGDQPNAIEELTAAIERGKRYNTLQGVTGSGKTFTIANVVANLNRPTLVLCHNKTLAAQLYSEFKNFFPDNAVEYYVSYYDYYQPEAYLPSTGTYIEKDLSINDEIEKMRLKTTTTLLSGRRDVIVVSSVSCIYGIGNPDDFRATAIAIKVGDRYSFKAILYKLVEALYTRTELELTSSTFRVNGDSVDVMSAFGGDCYRISMFDDEIEMIEVIDPTSGQRLSRISEATIYPANLFVTTKERIAHSIGQIYVDMGTQVAAFEQCGRVVEAQRLKQRVEYDLEMIKELGYCSGIENYSRYFDNRKPGMPPFCLLNYFPEDFIMVVDESHVTIPQIRGMYGGDKSRKENLVGYGFRLEAAKDNRPLTFSEFEALVDTSIYVSATPGEYESRLCDNKFVEQLLRPTGLVDPPMLLRPILMQIDDIVKEVNCCVERQDRVLITTITKRMAEEMSRYFDRIGVRSRYIHSDIDTIERVQILEDLRNGLFDVLVGVNLLREGLDLPEVAMVVVLDADKEGFLRNRRSLTQIAGRAARHSNGVALLYGNNCSDSLAEAIVISNRLRMKQIRYNLKMGQLPRQAQKSGTAKNQLLTSHPTEESMTIVNYPLVEEHYQIAAEPIANYGAGEKREKREKTSPKKTTSKSMGSKAEYAVDYTTGELIYRDESPAEERTVANVTYNIEANVADSVEIEALIAQAKANMESAAKALDFAVAMKYRDQMYELIKVRDTKVSYK